MHTRKLHQEKRLDSFILSSTGSRPAPVQEITQTGLRLHRPTSSASPHTTQQAHHLHSPSPAILNFTLQNLGLISGSSPGSAFAAPQTPERTNTLSSPLALQQRGMVFIKPVSPVPVQQSVSAQPLTLISVQQVKKTGAFYYLNWIGQYWFYKLCLIVTQYYSACENRDLSLSLCFTDFDYSVFLNISLKCINAT